eukprot:gene7828-10633_t
MISNEVFDRLLSTIQIIYCRSISLDFRRPVVAMFPNIRSSYFQIIEEPMDLGTILFDSIKEKLNEAEFLRKIKLVFSNSRKFNSEIPTMVALADHLEFFSGNLFEEIVQKSYRNSTINPNSFRLERLMKRSERYTNLCEEPLALSELRIVIRAFYDVQVQVPEVLVPCVNSATKLIVNVLSNVELYTIDTALCLKTIMQELVQLSLIPTTDENSTSNTPNYSFHPSLLQVKLDQNSTLMVREGCGSYLEALDDLFGILLVCMEERMTRGNIRSCIWAHFCKCVWAQPLNSKSNRSIWWPGLIISSNVNNLSPHHIPAIVSHINCSRIPFDLRKQLARTKPRLSTQVQSMTNIDSLLADSKGTDTNSESTDSLMVLANCSQSNSSNQQSINPSTVTSNKFEYSSDFNLTCPEGYLLIEFFGAHDFGWIKAETAIPFLGPESNSFPPNNSAKCSKEIIKEAMETFEWLQITQRRVGEISPNMKNHPYNSNSDHDIKLPSLSDLEDSLLLPAFDLLMENEIVNDLDDQCNVNNEAKNSNDAKTKKRSINNSPAVLNEDEEEHNPTKAKRKRRDFGVSFVPIDSDLDFDSMIEKNVFLVSRCPYPLLDVPILHRGSMKQRALFRMKGISYWMEKIKPLGYGRYDFKNSKPQIIVKEAKKKIGRLANESPAMFDSIQQQITSKDLANDLSPTQMILPHTSNNPPSNNGYQLNAIGGCTRYFTGEGLVHTRTVNIHAPLFFLEDKRCEIRKELLRKELERINDTMQQLQSIS